MKRFVASSFTKELQVMGYSVTEEEVFRSLKESKNCDLSSSIAFKLKDQPCSEKQKSS